MSSNICNNWRDSSKSILILKADSNFECMFSSIPAPFSFPNHCRKQCAQGRAAWLERGRRCSVQETPASCHRRWVKRNRVRRSTAMKRLRHRLEHVSLSLNYLADTRLIRWWLLGRWGLTRCAERPQFIRQCLPLRRFRYDSNWISNSVRRNRRERIQNGWTKTNRTIVNR